MSLWNKIAVIILIPAALAGGYFWLKSRPPAEKNGNYGNPKREVVINDKKYKLEEVRSAEKMALGLGGRESLCQECGMLFVFSGIGKHAFWMKGMFIPLDIFWLEGDKIVHIEKNIPPEKREIMDPPVSSDKVIELNAGTADKEGITVGQSLNLE